MGKITICSKLILFNNKDLALLKDGHLLIDMPIKDFWKIKT